MLPTLPPLRERAKEIQGYRVAGREADTQSDSIQHMYSSKPPVPHLGCCCWCTNRRSYRHITENPHFKSLQDSMRSQSLSPQQRYRAQHSSMSSAEPLPERVQGGNAKVRALRYLISFTHTLRRLKRSTSDSALSGTRRLKVRVLAASATTAATCAGAVPHSLWPWAWVGLGWGNRML